MDLLDGQKRTTVGRMGSRKGRDPDVRFGRVMLEQECGRKHFIDEGGRQTMRNRELGVEVELEYMVEVSEL